MVIVGLILGRFASVYAVLLATLLLVIPAAYLAQTYGFGLGLLSFFLSVAAMQIAYFFSHMLHLLNGTFAVYQAPSKSFL